MITDQHCDLVSFLVLSDVSSCCVIPKYLTWDESLIFWPLMWKFKCLVIILFLDLNITNSVLLVFKDSLFALIHSTTSFNSLLIYFIILFIDLSARIKLLSSAKWWTELNSMALCKSLINNINRRGLKLILVGLLTLNIFC